MLASMLLRSLPFFSTMCSSLLPCTTVGNSTLCLRPATYCFSISSAAICCTMGCCSLCCSDTTTGCSACRVLLSIVHCCQCCADVMGLALQSSGWHTGILECWQWRTMMGCRARWGSALLEAKHCTPFLLDIAHSMAQELNRWQQQHHS